MTLRRKIATLPYRIFSDAMVMLIRLQHLVLAITVLHIAGCNSIFLGRKDKDPPVDVFKTETEDGKARLVGDCVRISNDWAIPVHGFGLVVNLPGTGGEDANTFHYRMVFDNLNRDKVTGIRNILARPDTAVVEIRGQMRSGTHRGERFDVQVLLPPESETKSLRNGILLPTRLAEMQNFGNEFGRGATRAVVQGPILVDDPMANEMNNPGGLKKGTILSGAVTTESRQLSLIMRERSFFGVEQISKAINDRFHMPTGSRKGVASAETDAMLFLDIHPAYINDLDRFIRVIMAIAVFETPIQRHQRIERLAEEIHDPVTSQHASFQLEAIGRLGIEALRQALRSSDIEVRFHAATSLAYLGDGTSANVLAEIAREEPAFRVYALNALSVMQNDIEAEMHLQTLLHEPSAETRYGAFRALKNRNPFDQTIRGELLGEEDRRFSYHGITSSTAPMVHITTRRYQEVVLFGTDIFLRQPFTLEAGGTIYVNGQQPGRILITRFASSGIDQRREVTNHLDDVIRAVVDMGGTYPDIVQMLRQADMQGVLSCRLEIDRLPEPNRVYRRPGSETEEYDNEEEETKSASFWERLDPRNIFAPNPGEKSSDFTGTRNTSSRD